MERLAGHEEYDYAPVEFHLTFVSLSDISALLIFALMLHYKKITFKPGLAPGFFISFKLLFW